MASPRCILSTGAFSLRTFFPTSPPRYSLIFQHSFSISAFQSSSRVKPLVPVHVQPYQFSIRTMSSQPAHTVARTAENPYRVLIAGGCYSGLSAAVNLLEKCDESAESPIHVSIKIVDERDGYYPTTDRYYGESVALTPEPPKIADHLIGSPLALADKTYAEKAWVEYKDIKILQRPDVEIVQGTVSKVDPETKTATIAQSGGRGERIESYDFFIGATGLRRVWPVVPQSLTRKEYLLEAGKHIDAVTNAKYPVLVVGGGAVGIEMAAELKIVQPSAKVTLAHSRDKLLSAEPLPDSVKDCVLDMAKEAGVDVLLGHRMASSTPVKTEDGAEAYDVVFENGHKMRASVVITAVSRSVPSTDFLPPAALCEEEGLVKVLASMQFAAEGVANRESHFAVGDMIKWSGIKRCGGAMHEGNIAAVNIHQLMLRDADASREPKFMELAEIPPMIGLAVGKNGVAYGPEGMSVGKQVMKVFFEDDLGFRICWDHLRLGGSPA
ncbi:hypothetical protein BX600DRAFT_510583 [Xylariales sp. PMI_506]|nr:hypothetical protein BX600DRAFT_510583 [Xylariales sp. PMI_506]